MYCIYMYVSMCITVCVYVHVYWHVCMFCIKLGYCMHFVIVTRDLFGAFIDISEMCI